MLATYLCVTPSQPGVQHIGTASHVKNDDHLPLAPLSVPMLLKPRLANRAGLEVELFKLSRTVQDNALALQAVRHLRTTRPGTDRYAYEAALPGTIERAAHDSEHPDRPQDEREAVLAGRLLAAEGRYTSPERLAERLLRPGGGLAALLEDDLQEVRPGDRLWAAEYLTARYSTPEHQHGSRNDDRPDGFGGGLGTAEQVRAWQRHLQAAPAPALLAAAAAAPGAGPLARIAALPWPPRYGLSWRRCSPITTMPNWR